MLYFISQIDEGLAAAISYNIRVHVPKGLETPLNQNVPADSDPKKYTSIVKEGSLDKSAALSMLHTVKDSIRKRKIAILVADGVNSGNVLAVKDSLVKEGAAWDIIASRAGFVSGEDNTAIMISKSFLTTSSVFYDAVYIPGGINNVALLKADPDAIHFLNKAFKHCKAIAADTAALQALKPTYFRRKLPEDMTDETAQTEGAIIGAGQKFISQFIKAIAQHRFWEREKVRKVPA